MSAKKSQSGSLFAPLVRLARFALGPGRFLMMIGAIAAALGGGWYLGWQHVRARVLTGKDYQLDPRDIEISPRPPAWIHSDILAQVIRDASLDSPLSILDEDLTRRISQAFALQPWVAKVERVTKHHPARVEVVLVYRQPAAMVEIQGGLLPVDVEGVLLPINEFSPVEAQSYPRISQIGTAPLGPVGTRWGDVRVAGAARIAAALAKDWQRLKLYRIVAPAYLPKAQQADGYLYELQTHAGTRIAWGRSPSADISGELTAPEKVALLVHYAAEHGSLEGPDGPQQFDLRGHELVVVPHTAAKPQ